MSIYGAAVQTTRAARAARSLARGYYRHYRRRPLLTLVATFIALEVFIVTCGHAYAAWAATGVLGGDEITDSSGVPLTAYASLPLDYGDVFTAQKVGPSTAANAIWAGHVFFFGMMLELLRFTLGFTWVDWISAPFAAYADSIELVLGQIEWVPLALTIAAGVGGVAIISGRLVDGLVDMLISAVCVVLISGLLANPVAALTGPDGMITGAREAGSELAVAVIEDTDSSADTEIDTEELDEKDLSTVISDGVISQLVTAFVRLPAQEIAFGHALTGDCDATFTSKMIEDPPSSSSNGVRDAVGGCDAEAKEYVTHPSFVQAATAVAATQGGILVNIIALVALATFSLIVVWAFASAIKAMVMVHVAILPGTGRQSLWRSTFGMLCACLSLAASLIILLMLVTSIAWQFKVIAQSGLPVTIVMAMAFNFGLLFAVMVIVAIFKIKKGGNALADRLAALGFGSSKPKQGVQVAQALNRAVRTASHLKSLGSSSSPRPAPPVPTPSAAPSAPMPAPSASAPATFGTQRALPMAPADDPIPHFVERPEAPSGGQGPARSRGGRLAAGAARLALSARGGLHGIAAEAAIMTGEAAVERMARPKGALPAGSSAPGSGAALSLGQLGEEISAPSNLVITSTPSGPVRSSRSGRVIVVDRDGRGRVEQATHPDRFDIPRPTAPSTPTAASREVRDRLERAIQR